ncbi:hypothetical protein TRAPUB_12402 [Trametes pubescens]|uniref:F-box domain-containing protein n=1 Tax=Trametes pubescens TaxID=154538 RepID=A0A1M2VU83_TRAPU|nr:hypothetical protein TRAPUB_12402 [Trametes pubescens]
MIFEWLSRMDGIYVSGFGSRSSHSVDIMRVCKLWTDIATNTASIWQKIEVRTKADWLAIALPRSKGMPLDVTVYDASRILHSIEPLLTEEAPRLRSLKVFDGGNDVVDLLEGTVLAVDQLPCLETLLVAYCGGAYASLELCSFDDDDRFPALQVLTLNSLYIPWDSSVFRQLRVLQICEVWVPRQGTVPFSAFLATLQMCQNLEEIDFFFVSFIDFKDHELNETDFAVSLPRLRSFHWYWPAIQASDSPTDVYRLFEYLHFPPSVDIHLGLEVDLDIHNSHDEHDNNLKYVHIIPPDPACLPILRTMTSARLHAPGPRDFRGERTNDSFSGSDDLGSFRLSFDDLGDCGAWPFSRTTQCNDFCTLFARAPLTSLMIDLYELPLAPLLQVLRTFPHLVTLELFSGPGDVDATCVAGLFATLAADAGGPPDDPGMAIVLPALRILRLEGVRRSVHMQVLCTLFVCLALRAKRAVALLSRLRIEVYCPEIDGAEGVETCDGILAALQAVVEEPVEYIDSEDTDSEQDEVSRFPHIESHMASADQICHQGSE